MSIIIKGMHKTFGENHVLKGIDFTFESGKVNMIIGASGSGKTVLTKCMVGLIKPDAGEVYYDNLDFLKLNRRYLRHIRKQIGMLFQSSALFDSMTVEQNVSFPLQMFTRDSKPKILERVNYCLSKVNLEGKNTLYPSELSGGMRKRVGIARAIVLNPKYLFCDEPNSGLDPITASIIDELIQTITRDFNTTTIVITHDMKSVLSIADKIMFIYKGQNAWEGTRHNILTTQNNYLQDFIKKAGIIE